MLEKEKVDSEGTLEVEFGSVDVGVKAKTDEICKEETKEAYGKHSLKTYSSGENLLSYDHKYKEDCWK